MSKEKTVKTDAVENAKQEKSVKKAKQKDKKPGFFKRMGIRLKETFAELKKVNWPTIAVVLKKTAVVLGVVLLFLVVITAFDYGLYQLLALVSPKA